MIKETMKGFLGIVVISFFIVLAQQFTESNFFIQLFFACLVWASIGIWFELRPWVTNNKTKQKGISFIGKSPGVRDPKRLSHQNKIEPSFPKLFS